MRTPLKVLVVGGGIGGMSVAITLREQGHAVDLVELDPEWRVYGAGITITGATFRAFQRLGVLDAVLASGFGGEGITICDISGQRIATVPTPTVEDASVPGTGGIMRPVLHRILSERTLALGTRVHLGKTVDALANEGDALVATLSDGSVARYDLAVGADGLFSRVRTLLFPDAPRPAYTGQSVWRLAVPRVAAIDTRHFFLGGPVKVGLTPVSRDEMYMFLLETTPQRPVMADAELPGELSRLLEGYGGVLADVRAGLRPDSRIVLRPLQAFQLPAPWSRGRCILVGDAAHPTTPQLASGAGMAVEDALVLADELRRADSVEQAFAGFMARRYERCRMVVENSLEIGRREQSRAPVAEQTRLLEESLRVLARPI